MTIKEYNPLSLENIIRYMEHTKEENWNVGVCKSKDLTKDCFFSHLFNMGGNYFWEIFESMYATEFMMFPVNDGKNQKYQQNTPKERCIAYLKDLKDGKEKTTQQLMDEYESEYINQKTIE